MPGQKVSICLLFIVMYIAMCGLRTEQLLFFLRYVTPAPSAAAFLTEVLSYLIFKVMSEKSVPIDSLLVAVHHSIECLLCPLSHGDSEIGGQWGCRKVEGES